ncbi:MAG: hypothetical protein D6820_12355, partial [Lentisphaerae bacterium]
CEALQKDRLDTLQHVPGVPYEKAILKPWMLDAPHGKKAVWRLRFSVPPEQRHQPLVLEVDEYRVILQAYLDGRPVQFDKTYWGRAWEGGEGYLMLPPGSTRFTLFMQVQDLTHLYRNSFGHIRLRTAYFKEFFSLSKPKGGMVELKNRTFLPQQVTLRFWQEDYFGVPSNQTTIPVTLAPQQKKKLKLPSHLDLNKAWKNCFVLQRDSETSFEYWFYPDAEYFWHGRDQAVQLPKDGWQVLPVAEGTPFAFPLPKDGWQKVKLPYLVKISPRTTHRMWFYRKIKIPATWSHRHIRLFLPELRFKADVFIDGKKVGTVANWQLPGYLDLTGFVKAGSEHELALAVTDFIAALKPGIKVPPDGKFDVPSESLIAAVGHLPSGGKGGIPNIPELVASPRVFTDFAAVRTWVSAPRRIETRIAIRNTTRDKVAVEVRPTVYLRGKRILDLPARKVLLSAEATREITITKNWASPQLWTPEHPVLYELRVTLHDARSGQLIDLRRERFGFREIGIQGRFFTLNGKIVKLHGSGHITLNTWTWPVVPCPQAILRHHFKTRAFFMNGIDKNHLGDELGVFIKDENLSHNAHNGRRFDYQNPAMFNNLYSEMRAVYRFRPNHPSTFLWDVGNEVNFGGPGEAERMGELFKR